MAPHICQLHNCFVASHSTCSLKFKYVGERNMSLLWLPTNVRLTSME